MSRNPAMFDQEKLDWLNGSLHPRGGHRSAGGPPGERLASLGGDTDPSVVRGGATLVQERSRTVNEAAGMLRFLFEEAEPNDKARKLLAGQKEYPAAVADRLDALDDWSLESIHPALEALAEKRGLSKTKAFQPIRAAVTFSNVSPPLFESLALLGRERTMDRLRSAAG